MFKSDCHWLSIQSFSFQEILRNEHSFTTSMVTGRFLKTRDTIGKCQRQVFSLGVSQHMHKNKPVKIWTQLVVEVAEIMMEEKTPLSHKVVCFQMVDFRTSKSNSEVLRSNLWKMTSFSKTMLLQRELFLTMFYTINSSPLLVSK